MSSKYTGILKNNNFYDTALKLIISLPKNRVRYWHLFLFKKVARVSLSLISPPFFINQEASDML